MKKGFIVLLFLLVALLLVACNGPSDADCLANWNQLSSIANANALDYDSYEDYQEAFEEDMNMQVSLILNRVHAPDTVGYILKECIENGWDYREASRSGD